MTLYRPAPNDKRWAVIKYLTPKDQMKYMAVTAEQTITTDLEIRILGLHVEEVEARKIAKMLQDRWEQENVKQKAKDHGK